MTLTLSWWMLPFAFTAAGSVYAWLVDGEGEVALVVFAITWTLMAAARWLP